MGGSLAIALLMISCALLLVARRVFIFPQTVVQTEGQTRANSPHSRRKRAGHVLSLLVVIGLVVLPFPGWVPIITLREVAAGWLLLVQAGLLHWVANWLIVAGGTMALALLILLPVAGWERLHLQHVLLHLLAAIAFIAGLAIVPLWYLSLAWSRDANFLGLAGVEPLLLLIVIQACTVAAVLLWPLSFIWSSSSRRKDRVGTLLLGVGGCALLLSSHQFLGGIVLVEDFYQQMPLGGVALYLVGNPAAEGALLWIAGLSLISGAAFVWIWLALWDVCKRVST